MREQTAWVENVGVSPMDSQPLRCLSLSIFSEPTAWLTARRNCSRLYLQLSNLCEHILRLSFVRLTRFLARLMARPRVTLLTSDTLSMAGNKVNRLTRL